MLRSWFTVCARSFSRAPKANRARRQQRRTLLGVEALEERTVPSTFSYQAIGTTPVSLILTDNNQSVQVRNASTNAVLASAPWQPQRPCRSPAPPPQRPP